MRSVPERFVTYRQQHASEPRRTRGSRRNRAPLTAPRRSPLRPTPAWSRRSQAERRPVRNLHRCNINW
ncbi:MAG: hypothetical protein M9890_06470 [Thermomicrobiales bacterium]|nr:hypothetical protein [Thermomicrobiales bacterium]